MANLRIKIFRRKLKIFYTFKKGFKKANEKVAVILSGCGYLDGSEIRESVLTLLALDTVHIEYQIFAPDEPLFHVIDHVSGEINMTERRNILQEAARIARGEISLLHKLDANEFDGLILPGGFGVAKIYQRLPLKAQRHEYMVQWLQF